MAPLHAAIRRLSPLAPLVAAQLAAPKPPPPADRRKPPPGGRALRVFLPAQVGTREYARPVIKYRLYPMYFSSHRLISKAAPHNTTDGQLPIGHPTCS